MLEKLTRLLEDTDSAEKFCTSLQVPAKDFALSIKEVGPIKFPVTQKTAKALIKEGKLAAFGWRDQTVVDTRVRNVWELPKGKVKLPKQSFDKVLKPALEKIKAGLDLAPEGELSAELHNLVVYEKGQFFSNHQDSEKTDDMVATMVVLLPSAFKGGTLSIDQHGDKRSFRASTKVTDKLQIIAFYADCHHEVKKVTSGHRIALTFNLSFKAPKKLPASVSNPKFAKRIQEYFEMPSEDNSDSYIAQSDHPRWLVYLLDHQYSQKGLGWSQLKGPDRSRAEQLCAAADELNLEAYLALADVHETWQAEEEYEQEWGYGNDEYEDEVDDSEENVHLVDLIEDDYSLKYWLDSKGKRKNFGEHSVPKRMFCWTKANDEFDPFESEYEGFMGNYGNTMDRWYHRAAIVLFPKEQEYASQFAMNPIKTLKKVKAILARDTKQGAKILKQLLPQWNQLYRMEKSEQGELLEIALLAKDQDLGLGVLSKLNLEVVGKAHYPALKGLFISYGDEWAIKLLENFKAAVRFSSQYLADLQGAAKHFAEHNRVVTWLLKHQFSTITKSDRDKDSNTSRVDLQAAQKERLPMASGFLKAAILAKASDLLQDFVDHLLTHQRLYSNPILAKITSSLAKNSNSGPIKTLIAQAKSRLEAQLATKRETGDVSILETVPCRCADCKVLTEFLTSKDKKEFVWPIAKPRRQHIHQKLNGMGVGVTHETRRVGSPHQLVLKKTTSYFKQEAAIRSEALKHLKKLKVL